jgi:hypothetical protein
MEKQLPIIQQEIFDINIQQMVEDARMGLPVDLESLSEEQRAMFNQLNVKNTGGGAGNPITGFSVTTMF